MSVGQFDPNAVGLSTANTTIGTSAVQLKSSSTLAVKFTLTNTGSSPIYVGDSNVSASRYTVKITSGNNATFGESKMFGNQSQSYDLARFYAIATAAAQTLTLTQYIKGSSGGPF